MELESWAERWRELSEQVLQEMQAWRVAHPRATLREIEGEAEARLVRLRARLVEDTAQASAARDWTAGGGTSPPCPACGQRLRARGLERRQLTVPGDQAITLERRYATCSTCGAGFFPLG